MERFWSKARVGAGDECWPWTAAVFAERGGYGAFRYEGRATQAHRVALALSGVEVPPGAVVLHSCDNPPCVNPAHLRVGSHGDNVRDKEKKGRQLRGEQIGTHVLEEGDVLEIRASGETQAVLATRYGVSQACICNARSGKTWAHLPGARQRRARA